MAFGASRFIKDILKRSKAWCIVVLVLAILGLFPMMLLSLAGTETGEFCCTCPDYENFDAWLAKKAQLCDNAGNLIGQSGNHIGQNSKPADGGSNAIINMDILYPNSQLVTSASSKLDGLVIIDVRAPEEYASGHLHGARNLYWKETQAKERFDPILTESALRKGGINNSDAVLIYGGADDRASYVFWALSYLGFKNLSKLDGGIDDAPQEGLIVGNSISPINESNYTAHIVPSLLVNESQMGKWLERSDVQILDAREFSEYGRARLTNASLPLDPSKLYLEDFKIKDAKTIDEILSRRLDKSKIQIVYGTPQAYSLFYALELMGYNATILEGSWWKETEWAVNLIG
jgi:thiosulfate/3-mercaptopyruvate sulfurtransferase